MSTEEIFKILNVLNFKKSLFLIISSFLFSFLCSCNKVAPKRESSFRIGANFSLFTLDQYSINSLNDSFIYKLIYDQVLVVSDGNFKSVFLKDIYIKNKNLVFSIVSDSLYESLEAAYKEGLESNLWSLHFKKFKLTQKGLLNTGNGSFEDLKIISSYWMLKGEQFGRYKVKELIKNQRLVLISKDNKKLKFYRVKSTPQGLSALNANKIDFYFNQSVLEPELVSASSKLKFVNDESKSVYLRVYKRSEIKPFLSESLFKNLKQISKMLNSNFKLSKIKISDSKLNSPYKDLEVLFNNDLSQKVLDILVPEYKSLSGKDLVYEKLSIQKIAERLSAKKFDYYFSLDIEKNVPDLYYGSYHSKGEYNSFGISEDKLDYLLDAKKKSWDLKVRKDFDLKAKKILNGLSHKALEWKAPYYSSVYRKDLSLESINQRFGLSLKDK